MGLRLTLLSFLVSGTLLAQVPRIGIIDFYGLHRVTEDKLRKALGVKEGDPLPRSKGDVEERLEQVPNVVRARMEATCCEEGKAILYIGIEEKGAPTYNYRPPPDGKAELPEEILEPYRQFLEAVAGAVAARETGEDLTRGHSRMSFPAARDIQDNFVGLAETHIKILREVLRDAFDVQHRAIAAYVIGYHPKKALVVDDLQYALQDPEDAVRNHATRALAAIAVYALKHPDAEVKVSATWFVEMLHSILFTDRNNGAVALVDLTESRDQKVLDLIRERTAPQLVQMARWKHLPHALPAFILLGRLAGMEETAIQDAWSKGERARVIDAAEKRGKPAK